MLDTSPWLALAVGFGAGATLGLIIANQDQIAKRILSMVYLKTTLQPTIVSAETPQQQTPKTEGTGKE
jgi:hypothetical protein